LVALLDETREIRFQPSIFGVVTTRAFRCGHAAAGETAKSDAS
jgi:hypothetical protein